MFVYVSIFMSESLVTIFYILNMQRYLTHRM